MGSDPAKPDRFRPKRTGSGIYLEPAPSLLIHGLGSLGGRGILTTSGLQTELE